MSLQAQLHALAPFARGQAVKTIDSQDNVIKGWHLHIRDGRLSFHRFSYDENRNLATVVQEIAGDGWLAGFLGHHIDEIFETPESAMKACETGLADAGFVLLGDLLIEVTI